MFYFGSDILTEDLIELREDLEEVAFEEDDLDALEASPFYKALVTEIRKRTLTLVR